MENNDKFKLNTRRYLAWGVAAIASLTLAFIAAWGAVNSQIELVALAGGALIGYIGAIIGFYFSKKISEE